jgi:cytochrome P450
LVNCSQIGHSPLLSIWVALKPLGLDKLLAATSPKCVKDYYKFLDESVAERIKQEDKIASRDIDSGDEKSVSRDLFHGLYSSKDPDTGKPSFTHTQLRAEASLLIIAGSDTTAVAMTGIFFYLTRNERAYDKLVDEIRNTFVSVDEIRGGPKLASCRYLRACINESQRMTPSGLSEAPREVLQGGLEFDGTFLPQGTTVGCANWATSYSEEYYNDPWVYRPERWIVDPAAGVTTEDVARAQSMFHPFLMGTGNCIGQRVAMLELMIFVGRTLWRMDVRNADLGFGEERKRLGWGRRNKNILPVQDAYITL